MIIKLSPVRSDERLHLEKMGDVLRLNGATLDFAALPDGATLPSEAVSSRWICEPVERVDGELVVTVIMPHGALASEQSRFPVDIVRPGDGQVPLPTDSDPQPEEPGTAWPDVTAVINWAQVVTQEAKDATAVEQHLAVVLAEVAALRTAADSVIAPLQDAIDLDDATDAEVLTLKAWKKYRVALNRLPEQPGYPIDIDWPVPPA